MLFTQEGQLPITDAVLAGAGPAHGEGPVHKPLVESHCLREFCSVEGIKQIDHVKVSIANVADDGSRSSFALEVLFGLCDAFGQARDGHADVRRERPRSRSERERGVIGLMASGPESISLLRICGPLEAGSLVRMGDGLDCLR
jgi:hypothetical protein